MGISKLQVEESQERWSEFTLSDGTVVRAKVTMASAIRADGQYDASGNPLYIANIAPMISVVNVPKVSKKGTVKCVSMHQTQQRQ